MAQKDAPNYREADNPNQKCMNCCALVRGNYCNKFDFEIDKGFTCDAWCPDNKATAAVLRATARILDPDCEK